MKAIRILCVFALFMLVATATPPLIAQAVSSVAAASPDGPVRVPNAADEWGSAFVWSLLTSFGLQWWRSNAKLGGFSEKTHLIVQRTIAGLVAFGGSIGITYAFDPTTGHLSVDGLLLPTMWSAGLHWVRQFALQEFAYRAAVKER